MATVTSFQKKNRSNTLKINGTKPSLHKNQLLVSTGISSLDNLIGTLYNVDMFLIGALLTFCCEIRALSFTSVQSLQIRTFLNFTVLH